MSALPSEPDWLRTRLGQLLGPVGSIAPLTSGAGGASFLVDTGSGRVVAKCFAPGAQVLLGPAEQFALFGALADVGLAPAPAAVDAGARLLITEFVADAAAVPAASLREPERIREVAGILRRLHAVPLPLPAFVPTRYAERYLARIGGLDALGPADRRRYEELLGLAADTTLQAGALCHNDLTADNLLLGADPKLIDFDYAVTASPVVDLASLAVMNEFGEAEAEELLASYFAGSPRGTAEFARVQRLVRLLAHFWSLASVEADAESVVQYRIEDD